MLETGHPELSAREQCEVLNLCRSGLYYEPLRCSVENLNLMHLIDMIFTESPTYGSRRIDAVLHRHEIVVN